MHGALLRGGSQRVRGAALGSHFTTVSAVHKRGEAKADRSPDANCQLLAGSRLTNPDEVDGWST